MTKRPDNMETVRLALELLDRIPRNRKVTASELREQLANEGYSRDLRTIQRQLELLTEHYEIERDDSSKPYGYRWKERAVGLSVPALSAQESLLLILARQHLSKLLPDSVMKSMAGFFDQADRMLDPLTGEPKGRAWLSKVRVVSETQPLLPPTIREGVFEEISQALYEDRWLDIEYVNSMGECRSGSFMPLGLGQQGVRLYLVGRFAGSEKDRIMALHRFTSVKASTLPFDRPKNFDLQKYAEDAKFGWGEGERIRLTFLIDKGAGQHLLESPLSTDQEVSEVGDQLEISATVVDSFQLRRWLLSFGDEIRDVRKESGESYW
jgi:predicted DNA-binding transcriptional regulator YafY